MGNAFWLHVLKKQLLPVHPCVITRDKEKTTPALKEVTVLPAEAAVRKYRTR